MFHPDVEFQDDQVIHRDAVRENWRAAIHTALEQLQAVPKHLHADQIRRLAGLFEFSTCSLFRSI